MTHRTPRPALTLIELLVVFAIVGVLVGLLLPAVQKVREAAARAACQNNLKQVALASHNYESAYGNFPSGADRAMVGPIAYMLPFMEQDAIFKQFNFQTPLLAPSPAQPPPLGYRDPSLNPPNNIEIRSGGGSPDPPPPPPGKSMWPLFADVKGLICPSAPSKGEQVGALYFSAQSYYDDDLTRKGFWQATRVASGLPINAGFTFAAFNPARGNVGRSNYVAVGGYPVFDTSCGCVDGSHPATQRFAGIYTYESKTRLSDIADGTSNTLAFGEYAGYLNTASLFGDIQPPGGPVGASWATSNIFTYWGLNSDVEPNSTYYFFTSKHGNIVQFAFGDGSVRSLNRDIDFGTYVVLGGMADGVVLQPY